MKRFSFLVLLLALCFCTARGADKPEYLASFDPAKGFKPAQRDLTEIFLQLAGSLEAYGSPEPYLRHVVAEHRRIEGLYHRKFGKDPKSFRPAYMTDDYVDHLCENWNLLSPKLGLAPYAKDFGNTMRDAINGTRGTGTIIVDIFNRHQARVFDAVSGKATSQADFESLRSELVTLLELNDKPVDYRNLEIAKRDGISFSRDIHGSTDQLFAKIDRGVKPETAEKIKTVLTSVIIDTGNMAQSELEAGIAEWAITSSSTAGR